MSMVIELDIPDDLSRFRLPPGVNSRLQELLNRQDQGTLLSPAEKQEAEGLVEGTPGQQRRHLPYHLPQIGFVRLLNFPIVDHKPLPINN